MLLRHAGHATLLAENGESALRALEGDAVDLLITDLSMPGVGGTDLVRAARKRRSRDELRIALYTATPQHRALDDFMEIYSVAAFIPKPSDPEAILAALEAALAP